MRRWAPPSHGCPLAEPVPGEAVLRGALVGVGNVAVNGHLPGWLERADCALVAAADARPEARSALAERLPEVRWYDGIDAMLTAERIDFVDICTPPSSHAELILKALAGGAHVLCEKPLVTRAEDLAPIRAAAMRRERVVDTVHNWLHAPPVGVVTRLIGEGAIGTPRRCRWRTIRNQPAAGADPDTRNWRSDPERAGGGILVDHGWHALYVVCTWMGGAPQEISAELGRSAPGDPRIEDTAELVLGFAGGQAEIYLTWTGPGRANDAQIVGSEGRIRLDDNRVLLEPAASGEARREWTFPSGLTAGSHHPDWFAGVAQAFVSAVRSGKGAEVGNLAEAELCARLIERARHSAAGRRALAAG